MLPQISSSEQVAPPFMMPEELENLWKIIEQWAQQQIEGYMGVSIVDVNEIIESIKAMLQDIQDSQTHQDLEAPIRFIVGSSDYDAPVMVTCLPEIFQLKVFERIDHFALHNLVNMEKLPITIDRVRQIKYFCIEHCSIDEIPPDFISNNPEIKYFIVTDSRLKYISDDICNLTSLEYLDLSNNQLTWLPSNLSNLNVNRAEEGHLLFLNISSNQITLLPDSIRNLHRWLIDYSDNPCFQDEGSDAWFASKFIAGWIGQNNERIMIELYQGGTQNNLNIVMEQSQSGVQPECTNQSSVQLEHAEQSSLQSENLNQDRIESENPEQNSEWQEEFDQLVKNLEVDSDDDLSTSSSQSHA